MGLNWAAWVTPFLLPLSYVWDLVSYWSILITFHRSRGLVSHGEKVVRVVDQVSRWTRAGLSKLSASRGC